MDSGEIRPPEQIQSPESISQEFANLYDRFRLVEQIDQQTTEMVARLAEAVRVSAEARALASLNISVSLQRLARLLEDRQVRQLGALSALSDDIAVANADAEEVRTVVQELETRLAEAVNRLGQEQVEFDVHEPTPVHANFSSTASQSGQLLSIVIEDVPNAVTALAIQQFISANPNVVSAIARAFTLGVLRFDLRLHDGCAELDLAKESGGGLVHAGHSSSESRFVLVCPGRFLDPR